MTLIQRNQGLSQSFRVGGVPLGETAPTTSTSGAGNAQQKRELQSMPAPRAFDNPLELVSFLRDQSVRDVLHTIGIGSKNNAENASDGKVVGGDGSVNPGDADWRATPPFKPAGGARDGRRLLEINGINTTLDVQRSNLQFLADASGREVVGIHNASGGLVEDALQFLNDKYVRCDNPAVNSVRDAVLLSVKKGEDIDLVCHSQGGIITARALIEAQAELKQELKPATYERFLGPDWERISKKAFPSNVEKRQLKMAKQQLEAQVENVFSRVHVQSFGGAARIWPDGPQYVHHVNMADPVPTLFGQGFVVPPTHPGKGAIVHRFEERHPTDKKGADAVDASVHGPEQVYFKHIVAGYDEAAKRAASGDKAWKRYD